MNTPSNRVLNLPESETLAMAKLSRELKAKGYDIINLSLGEPDFNTPDFVKTAAIDAVNNNFSQYTPVNGYLDLREAIAHKLQRDNKLNYTADQIVVSTGAKQSLTNVVLSLVNPGEEVILPAPYWVSYKAMVALAEGHSIILNSTVENDYKVSAAEIEKAITPKTKLIIFSSPCNPSGSVYTYHELAELAAVLERNPHVYIVSDEIYELIQFGAKHHSIATFDAIYNQVITVNGVSKGFAMTGWRIGYIAAPKWIADACTKIQGQFTSGASSIAQRAAKAAIEASPNKVDYMVETFQKRRDLMLSLVQEIPGLKSHVPQGAFYLFPDASFYFGKSWGEHKINNASDLCNYLLYEANVALVPGDAFGSPQCIRISYATSDDLLIEAMKRVKSALEKLN